MYEHSKTETKNGDAYERREIKTEPGLQRLELERHLGNRQRTITKEKRPGRQDQTVDTAVNMHNDTDLAAFDNDWTRRLHEQQNNLRPLPQRVPWLP